MQQATFVDVPPDATSALSDVLGHASSKRRVASFVSAPATHAPRDATRAAARWARVAAQLIERIGWALADAEDAERAASGS